jgi:hypothetical protein
MQASKVSDPEIANAHIDILYAGAVAGHFERRKAWDNWPGGHTDACLNWGQKEVDSNEAFKFDQQVSPDLRSRFLGA